MGQTLKIKADSKTHFPLNPIPWPTKGLRRASVNSFGFGGTNAHAILDDAFHYLRDHGLAGNHSSVQDPPLAGELYVGGGLKSFIQVEPDSKLQASAPKLLVLSANDEDGLKRLAAQYMQLFREMSTPCSSLDSYLESLAYTLNSRRSLLPWKSCLLAESMEDLHQLSLNLSPARRFISKPTLGFIFTGQGAQWAGMGRDLRIFDIFEQRLREAEEYMIELGCRWQLRGT